MQVFEKINNFERYSNDYWYEEYMKHLTRYQLYCKLTDKN